MFLTLMRRLLFWGVVWPVVWLFMGIAARNRGGIPSKGPAILAVNHNSHLDHLVILVLTQHGRHLIRPVGAADYWFKNPILRWVSTRLLRMIAIDRKSGDALTQLLEGCERVLLKDEIVLIFPEGTRGKPEEMGRLRSGIAVLAEKFPSVPVVPIYLHGLGKILPSGEWLPVPFTCDAYVGDSFTWTGDKDSFMARLERGFLDLKAQHKGVGSWA